MNKFNIYKKDILFFLIWIMGIFIVFNFILMPVDVSGQSMYPQLENQEKLLGLRNANIKRFDIVTFQAPDDDSKDYIKRVIGLPGETIAYKGNTLYINGVKQKEPFLSQKGAHLSEKVTTEDFTIIVPQNSYFVLGDNRLASKDSRYFGPIDSESINSKIIFSLYPFDKIEWLF
ncbi:signal peptidase I [Bacillus thuringiensis]|uniref:Signal peptidase I n=1 Tax=Bacillus thuringiensis TaxID=1428 RepID=A0ABD6R4W5_BACTU|nr:signal peptidase I [Bacillus thuringiensis]OPD49246.1 signal peptidase I [Bacillus thuringiensis]